MAAKTASKTAAKTRLVPLADRLVITPLKQEEVTTSGLVIPDTAKEKPQQGEVVAVGPGRFEDGKRIPLDVQVGNRVLYGKYSGTEVVAVGPGRLDDAGKRVDMGLAVGDRVLYAKYTGTDIKLDNVDYIVLNEKDVLCKLEV